jgi:hypothetical protein
MQPIASIHLSLTSSSHDLCDDATCTTRHRSFTSFEANWETLAWLASRWNKPLDFDASRAVLLSSILCRNQQTIARLVLRPKSRIRCGDFETQITKLQLPVLRLKPENPSTLVLRLNQETRALRLLVHGADHTQHHPTSQSFDHWVPDLCLTIPGPLH